MKSISLSFLKQAINDPSLIRSEDSSWLTHIKPVIAMQPTDYNMQNLYNALQENNTLGEFSGEIITTRHLRYIYAILKTHNRSDILPKKMTQTLYPQYSSAVPIVLAAYREQFGVKYSQWNPNNEYMRTAILGKQLETLPEVYKYLVGLKDRKVEFQNDTEIGDEEYCDSLGIETPESIDVFDIEVRRELREFTLDGGILQPTAYTALKRYHPTHPLGSANLSKFYWCMLTQTWIFDPKVRHPDMVTQLTNIDKLAEPLAEFSSIKEVKGLTLD